MGEMVSKKTRVTDLQPARITMTRHASPLHPTVSARAYFRTCIHGGLFRKVRQTTLLLMSQESVDVEKFRRNRRQKRLLHSSSATAWEN
tara:strand:+ start:1014 stop:1280 length:267 start_codon:yes stop_codon:yes gene_type:complete